MKSAKQTKQPVTLKFWGRPLIRKLLLFGLIPALIYFVLFCVLTWPLITYFNGWFFTDGGDGLQNVWNIWWVHKAVIDLNQLPWHTGYLHYPWGVTLLGQTLNPFNGFVAIPLMLLLSLNQAFNVMVIFSFVMSGLTTLWLCYYFTKAYIPSIIGGLVFAFSSYHFAHTIGHMQLVSLEWLPLFILLWWKLLKKPSYALAIGASATLLLTLLCDYYYFVYCVVTAAAIAVYVWRKKELANLHRKQVYRPFAVFGALSLLIVAPLPLALLRLNSTDILVGSHDARVYSTDLISPFVDGGFWRFHSLTDAYWHHVVAFVAESSVYIGVSVLVLIMYALVKRKKIHKDINFWLGLIVVFGILSLGPRLLVAGKSIQHIPLPYALLERLVPQIKLSGVPVRMMVMVTLGAAVISAMVLAKVNTSQHRGKLILAAFALILLFEMWPANIPATPNTQPKYVVALRKLPAGAALDNAAKGEPDQLYHQVYFEKPVALGYISRTPQSVATKDAYIVEQVTTQKYTGLCSKYKLRYITTPAWRPLKTSFPIVYQDKQAIIYDIKTGPGC